MQRTADQQKRYATFLEELDKMEMWATRMSASQILSVKAQEAACELLDKIATLRENVRES